MHKHLSSAKSVKDQGILVDLDNLALAMHADATFMSDEDYAAAQSRLAKRKQILQPPKPLRLTRYGAYVLGICIGVIIALLIAYVMRISGTFAGVALAAGIALFLGVIGVGMGDNE